jgi:hypothetical protein
MRAADLAPGKDAAPPGLNDRISTANPLPWKWLTRVETPP